jgi:hypothetical protein
MVQMLIQEQGVRSVQQQDIDQVVVYNVDRETVI